MAEGAASPLRPYPTSTLAYVPVSSANRLRCATPGPSALWQRPAPEALSGGHQPEARGGDYQTADDRIAAVISMGAAPESRSPVRRRCDRKPQSAGCAQRPRTEAPTANRYTDMQRNGQLWLYLATGALAVGGARPRPPPSPREWVRAATARQSSGPCSAVPSCQQKGWRTQAEMLEEGV